MLRHGRAVLVTWAFNIVACAPTYAQVSGRVMNTQDQWPVQRAVVRIVGTTLVAYTDSGGRFRLSGPFAAGCHRLQVRAIGHGWTEVRFATSTDTATVDLGDVPVRAAPIPEWPLLLVDRCDAGPLTKKDAPWGVDTLRPNQR